MQTTSSPVAYIYALVDPSDKSMRYVGYTSDPKHRICAHIGTTFADTPRAIWIVHLKERGLQPILKALQCVPLADATLHETKWIRNLRSAGVPLLNCKISRSDTYGAKRRRRRRKAYNAL